MAFVVGHVGRFDGDVAVDGAGGGSGDSGGG